MDNQVAVQCYFNVEAEHTMTSPMEISEPQTRITNPVEVNSTTRISSTAIGGQTHDVIEVLMISHFLLHESV